MQYATYPMKVMRHSAIWNTSTPHQKCSGTGRYKGANRRDYPTDLVGKDTSASGVFYAPCDVVCPKVYNKASHGLWFRSANKVHMPIGDGYLYFMAEHMSVSGFKVGKTYKKGTRLFNENSYGNASGPHIHLSVGWSKSKKSLGSGWCKNNKGAWILWINGVTNIKIEQAFFIDKSFTKTVLDKRIKFKELPTGQTKKPKYKVGKTYTLLDNMNVRSSASINGKIKKVYKKGTKVTCKGVYVQGGYVWIKISSNKEYICAEQYGDAHIK